MARVKYNAHIDLKGNDLLNAVIQGLTNTPLDVRAGRIIYNQDKKIFQGYDGEDWQDLSYEFAGVFDDEEDLPDESKQDYLAAAKDSGDLVLYLFDDGSWKK